MSKLYPTKFFTHSMQGASQTGDNDAGTMIKILRECLVDGFGELVPTSIVWDNTRNWAKATFQDPHAYEKDSIILCTGSTVTEYNGEHRVMLTTDTEMWFELDTDVVPEADAAGVIEIKVAPIGWTITFENATRDVIIFSPPEDLGNVSLRIDNTAFEGWYNAAYNRYAKVAMIENVLTLDSYDLIYEHRWTCTGYRSNHTWDLVGNKNIFFFLPEMGYNKRQCGYIAGYIDSIRPGDRYHFVMNRAGSTNVNSGSYRLDNNNDDIYTRLAGNYQTDRNIIARKYHQLEGTSAWMKTGLRSYNADVMPSPNPVDNGFYISTDKAMILESDNSFRGYMPIMVYPLSNTTAYKRKNLKNLPEFPGKIFRMLMAPRDNVYDCLTGFDVSTVEV